MQKPKRPLVPSVTEIRDESGKATGFRASDGLRFQRELLQYAKDMVEYENYLKIEAQKEEQKKRKALWEAKKGKK